MDGTGYVFHISAYDSNKLLPQVSKALEKRTELISRKRFPFMWKLTDSFNSLSRKKPKNRPQTSIAAIICFALGIFLFIPGIAEPQKLFVPLITGAAAIAVGAAGLWRGKKRRENAFDKPARKLLTGIGNISAQHKVTVSFSDDGMTLAAANADAVFVAYNDFECAVETEDIFLFVYRDCVTVLQKSDLEATRIDGFHKFISGKIEKCQFV